MENTLYYGIQAIGTIDVIDIIGILCGNLSGIREY